MASTPMIRADAFGLLPSLLILLLLVFSGATRYIVGPLFGLVNALYLTVVAAIF